MKILKPVILQDKNTVKLQSTIEHGEHRSSLWYSVDKEHAKWLTTEKQDAFLVALLPLAMKNNEDIYLEGAVSERLYYNLTNHFMKILTIICPSLNSIKIYPKELDSGISNKAQKGVATGVSGGVDSFCVIRDHLFQDTSNGYKLTHLVFTNVGSHGFSARGRNIFQLRRKQISRLAEELNLPLVIVNSNLHNIIKENFLLTHTMSNISATLTMQKLFKKYLYASSYKYEDCLTGNKRDKINNISYTDPAAIHLLSTETLECVLSGAQYTRTEKTMRISDVELTYRYLDVCVNPIGAEKLNCSECFKCLRTLLTLDILGKLELYEEVFDLNKYYKTKKSYILNVLSDRDIFCPEIIQLAKEEHFSFPLKVRITAYIKKTRLGHVLLKVKRGFNLR